MPILQLVLFHHHQRLVLFFLSATNCEYFSTDGYNQKENVYYLQLSKVFQEYIIAFTSAGTDVMAWTVNLICSNKKADVNF